MINTQTRLVLASLILIFSMNVQAQSLHQAVTEKDIESVKSQLDNGADINQLGFRPA